MMFLVDHAKSFQLVLQQPLPTINRSLRPSLRPSTTSPQRRVSTVLAMARVVPFFILILLVFSEMSLGQAGSIVNGAKPKYSLRKMHPRKILVEVTLDYDYGGANSRHDPKRGKPGNGGGGKNP